MAKRKGKAKDPAAVASGRKGGLARAKKLAERRALGEMTFGEEFGGGWEPWAKLVKGERNFDPLGFARRIYGGEFEVKLKDAAGLGALGLGVFKPRAFQRKWYKEIAEHRRSGQGRFNRLVVKSRQLGFSVGHDLALVSDATENAGADVVITAHQDETLFALSENIRTFLGRDKKEGKAKRMADKKFETPRGSMVKLLGAKDSLARGDAPLHLHVSEADYIEDIDAALDSVLPAVNRSNMATVVLESTIRRDSSSGFRDFLARCKKGKTAYKIEFIGWRDDETAILPVTPSQVEELIETQTDYERMLQEKHHCSWEQIAWWRQRFLEDARGNLESMIEMNPSDEDEAIKSAEGVEFLDPGALDFMRECLGEPIERRRPLYDSFDEILSPNEWANSPHAAIWEQFNPHHEYVVGADGADASNRIDWEQGSECAIEVLDITAGEQVAEWHGHANNPEFAIAMWRLARYYGQALVVPEQNRAKGAIDYLMETLGYRNVYERESYGTVVTRYAGLYGFDTRGGSRPVLVQRLQSNLNRKALLIRSRYLYDQLEYAGRRKFAPQKAQKRSGETADDCAMALGMCMFGHQAAVDGRWQPKDAVSYSEARRITIDTTDRARQARGEFDLRDDDDDDRFERAREILNMT